MNETDRDLVFSESVKAGKRIYYFDVKQSRNGDRFVAITESKKINEGTVENPRFVFEKHKIFLYKEDFQKLVNALTKTLGVATTGIIPEIEHAAYEPEPAQVAPQAPVAEAPAPAEVAAPAQAAAPAEAPKFATESTISQPSDKSGDDSAQKPKKGWFSW